MLTTKHLVSRNCLKKIIDKLFISRSCPAHIQKAHTRDSLTRARKNAAYLAMLDKSISEAQAGGFITKTIAELEKYE